MSRLKAHEIKREQKKSLFLKEISKLIQAISADEEDVAGVYPSRVDFSADTGICYVYFATFTESEQETFDKALRVLKMYKPSIRTALSKEIKSRYVPDLVFLYDEVKIKERRINDLLDKVQRDLESIKDK